MGTGSCLDVGVMGHRQQTTEALDSAPQHIQVIDTSPSAGINETTLRYELSRCPGARGGALALKGPPPRPFVKPPTRHGLSGKMTAPVAT